MNLTLLDSALVAYRSSLTRYLTGQVKYFPHTDPPCPAYATWATMDPLDEEAALFEVNYGSEETPITASGPHTKVGGNPATDRRPHATSPIDIALGRRRDVQQNLFPDGERQERDKRDKSMDRVAGLLGALPRPRHSAGHHTQPDKNLFEHDEIEFAQWILGMEPAEEIVNQLRREPISGPLWKELVTNGAGQLRETAAQDIQSLWPNATRYFIIRLMSESRNHLVQLQQQAEAEKGLHTREVMAIHFPPMPTAAGADDRLTHEQLKAYKSSLIAKLQDIPGAETYAQHMEEQFDHPDQDRAQLFLQVCSKTCRQVDVHLAAKLMEAAGQTFMHNIIMEDGHRFGTLHSGLCIISSIAKSLTSMTAHRVGALLKQYFSPLTTQVSDYKDLQPTYNKFIEAKGTLSKLGVDMPLQVEAFLLQEMAGILAGRQQMNLILGIPMAQLIQDGFNNPVEMNKLIQRTIHEINNSPGKYVYTPRRPPPRAPVPGQLALPAPTKGVHPVQPVDRKARMCVSRREASWSNQDCVRQPGTALGQCPNIHFDTKGIQVCTDPKYKEYGRCLNYFTTCQHKHPWTEEHKKKHGSISVAWSKLCDTKNPAKAHPVINSEISRSNIMARPRSSRSTKGKTRAERGFVLVAEAKAAADAEFIKESVPEEELFAALEDEDLEQDYEDDQDEDPDPDPIEEIMAPVEQEQDDDEEEMAEATELLAEMQQVLEDGDQDYEDDQDTSSDTVTEEEPDSPDREAIRYALLEEDAMAKVGEVETMIIAGVEERMTVPRLMFDDGTFNHMWGTDMVRAGMVYNIRDIPTKHVGAAGGGMQLTQMGDVTLDGYDFLGGHINPHMGLSLLSEGKLSKYEGWGFQNMDGQLHVDTNLGDQFKAEMHGNLGFWPQEVIMETIQGLHHTGDTTETEDDDYSAPDPNPSQGMGVTLTEATGGTPVVQSEGSYISPTQEDPNPSLDGSQQAGISPGQPTQIPGAARAEPGTAVTEATANQAHIERLEDVRDRVRSNATDPGDTLGTQIKAMDINAANFEPKPACPTQVSEQPAGQSDPDPNPGPFEEKARDGTTDLKTSSTTYFIAKGHEADTYSNKEVTFDSPIQQIMGDGAMGVDIEPPKMDGKMPSDPRTKEYAQHCLDGHPFDPKCEVCNRAYMRNKPALRSKGTTKVANSYLRLMEGANTDVLKFNAKDVDGNIAASGIIMPGTAFGEVELMSNMGSITKEQKWRRMAHRIQSQTDPGGRAGYKIERMHSDQGTENAGAHKSAMDEGNIVNTKSHRDYHTGNTAIEGYFNRLQTKAAAIGVGGIGDDEHLLQQTMGGRIKHSCRLLQFKPTTPAQKEQGISPIQEQYHMLSQNEKPTLTLGDLVIGYVAKDERPNKLGPRGFRCIYQTDDLDIPGNIIVWPFTTTEDGHHWEVLPSRSINQYRACPGVAILVTPPHKAGPVAMDFRNPQDGEMSYAQVKKMFSDPDPVPEQESDDDEESAEVEKIVDHVVKEDAEIEYKVRWKGYDHTWDSWRTKEELGDCQTIMNDYMERIIKDEPETDGEAMAALDTMEIDMELAMANLESEMSESHKMLGELTMACMVFEKGTPDTLEISQYQAAHFVGDSMLDEEDLSMGAEVKPRDFIKTPEGVKAINKELTEMTTRRFDFNRPVPEHLKKTAMEARLVCNHKRDLSAKARLVIKDLKRRRQVDARKTYAAVPGQYGIRLLVAATNKKGHIKSTTDLVTAYLQSEEWDEGSWMLIKYRDPFTEEWVYVWLRGEVYGLQTAGSSWKKSLVNRMVMKGHFVEIRNQENMYYHPVRKVLVAVFVDDPLKDAPDEESHRWFHDFMDREFDTNGENRLEPENPIDFLSMEMSITYAEVVCLSNKQKIETMLKEAGFEEIKESTTAPLMKTKLKQAYELTEPLDPKEAEEMDQHKGRFNWIAETTHPSLRTASSIYSGMPPIKGSLLVMESLYSWMKAHRHEGICADPENQEGFMIYVDSDWGGMHSICGELRSRTGIIITYNGMPIYWKSNLQKTQCTEFHPEEGAKFDIATSSAAAEVQAGAEATGVLLHLKYITEELGMEVPSPQIIYTDATAAMGFFRNTGAGGKMKHIDIRLGWVQQIRDRSLVDWEKIPGELNPADAMTKLLEGRDFERHHKAWMRAITLN